VAAPVTDVRQHAKAADAIEYRMNNLDIPRPGPADSFRALAVHILGFPLGRGPQVAQHPEHRAIRAQVTALQSHSALVRGRERRSAAEGLLSLL
jgi:hypothetical protein